MQTQKVIPSKERQDLYRNVFYNEIPLNVLALITFPESYNKDCTLSTLLKMNMVDSHIDKVVSYEIIWCTGNEIFYEFDVSSPEDLNRDDINADYARIIDFEGKKVLFVYSKF